MTKTFLVIPAGLVPVMALFSCAPPKAIVVELPAPPKNEVAAVVEPERAEPSPPSLANDRMRLPDMMTLPKDDEFRATNPGQPAPGTESGAVIARPPMEPPSRPKNGE